MTEFEKMFGDHNDELRREAWLEGFKVGFKDGAWQQLQYGAGTTDGNPYTPEVIQEASNKALIKEGF
jgi:hypothetical protein